MRVRVVWSRLDAGPARKCQVEGSPSGLRKAWLAVEAPCLRGRRHS